MKQVGKLLNIDLPDRSKEKEPIYRCALCKDTGYIIDGEVAKRCRCQYAADMKVRKERMGITPHMMKMTFADFDLSYYSEEKRSNKKMTYREGAKVVLSAAKSFVCDVAAGRDCLGLFLQGDVGCGKTYLAAAIANALAEQSKEVKFVVVPDFLDQLRSTYQGNTDATESDLMEEIKKAPILILDDLGAHNYTEWSVNILYSIVNYRVNYELPMVITSNLEMSEIDDLVGSRFSSRLMEACRFYQLNVAVDIRKAARNTRIR